MSDLFKNLYSSDEYQKFKDEISGQRSVLVTGVPEISKAHILAAFLKDSGKRACVICQNEPAASSMQKNLEGFLGEDVARLIPAEIDFGNTIKASYDIRGERVSAINMIKNGASAVMSAAALLCFVMPEKEFTQKTLSLSVGDTVEDIAKTLTDMGYERNYEVSGEGQFAVRGGICDVFPPSFEEGVRIEFFDDEVDSLRYFDPKSQLSTEKIDTCSIIPANGDSGEGCITEYFGEDTVFVIEESLKTCDGAQSFVQNIEARIAEHTLNGEKIAAFPVLSYQSIVENLAKRSLVAMNAVSAATPYFQPESTLSFTVKILSSYSGKIDILMQDVAYWREKNYSTLIMAGSKSRAEGIASALAEQEISFANEEMGYEGVVGISTKPLEKSFEYPKIKTVFVSGGDVFIKERKRRRVKDAGDAIRSFDELAVSDFVVHRAHGIGQFEELVSMEVAGVKRDYLKIRYKGTDVLYVPANQLNLLYKYSHAGEDTPAPKINKLGTSQWQNTKNRVKKSAKELAIKLIDLYAERNRMTGHAFSADTLWQQQFEEEFSFEETPDQIKSIEEIKRDMEKSRPMDRLLCGDVGYGKTEVAVRAAFKCVMDGYQCAYLVPTTILASQHYNHFIERMKTFPIKVEMLSRFRTKAQQQQIIKALKKGEIDIIVGTHRLLGDDVTFKNLGLLVIDEEQRFGVGHKEKIKNLKRGIDVLTLTATPIPRTLNMAMTGIRDMSIISMPPKERQPIQTYIMEHSDFVAKDAIEREMARGGQTYYVYNRVSNIYNKAAKIKEMIPEAEVAVAHGQMSERELEEIMLKVLDGEVDVLVCTTIIETGIDIPNVNTMIVENADCMGLSQLYQLRGRVGRSNRVAYAYLTFRRDKSLSEIAEKRLMAIKEFTELGAGFKIALRDLEIRGAGDVLGPEQHGFMSSVGYDMYLKLLSEAVEEMGGENTEYKTESVIDIAVSAGIPEEYIADTRSRLEAYRLIAGIENEEDKLSVTDELLDRFGDVPPETMSLIEVAMLRVYASEAGVKEVSGNKIKTVFTFDEKNPPMPEALSLIITKYRKKILFSAGEKPYLTLKNEGENEKDLINNIKNLLKDLKLRQD